MATETNFLQYIEQGSDPATPAASRWRLYFKSGGLYAVDDAGTVIGPFATSGSGIPATILDAKGDIIAASAADTAARLPVSGTNGHVLTEASGQATGLIFAYPALTTADATMAGDVTIVNAATFYDGPATGSLAAGTWLVAWKATATVIVATSQSYYWNGKLWDGTNVFDEAQVGLEVTQNNNAWYAVLSGSAIVVLGAPTAIKVSVACVRASSASKITRDVPNNSAASHTASRITAVRIA